jgi:hypothetical protein
LAQSSVVDKYILLVVMLFGLEKPDVAEELPSSGSKIKPSKKLQAEHTACVLLVSCLAYSVTLKMEAICSSETLDFSKLHLVTTQKFLHSHHCENLKSS